MHVGNKNFPYPILNKEKELSDYKSAVFKFIFKKQLDGGIKRNSQKLFLEDIKFVLEDKLLNKLYIENKLKCALVIEASSAMYRKVFEITNLESNIEIPIKDLSGEVVISAYMYATDVIKDYVNPDFIVEYEGYKFDFDKYEILAIDDGYKFKIDADDIEGDTATSIFSIIKKEDNEDIMTYDYTGKKVKIYLSQEYYNIYSNYKDLSQTQNIFFAMIVVPILTYSLMEILKDVEYSTEVEDIEDDYNWFKSIRIAYVKIYNKPFLLDDFMDINMNEFVQEMFNNTVCGALKDLDKELLNGGRSEEDEEEED